jgi:four helix bundle protein
MEQESTRIVSFFRFEDLRIYHKALDYVDWVNNTISLFPGNGGNGLSNKFVNTAQTIAFFIAEGSARNKSQFVYYLKLAKSAVRECVVLTSVFEKQGMLTQESVELSRGQLIEMTKMIGALIGSLQKPGHKPGIKHAETETEEELEFVDQINSRRY